MRSLISLSLVFLATVLSSPVAHAASFSTSDCKSEICAAKSPAASLVHVDLNPGVILGQRDLSNAQRLARGLGLKPPARRSSGVLAARRPQASPSPQSTYTGVIQVFAGATSLGYLAPDPIYWTPLLTSDITAASSVSFQLNTGATAGSQLSLVLNYDNRGTYFAPVVGRDSTSSNIGTGSFNYLYLDPVSTATAGGSTPQNDPSYFSTTSGLNKQAETSVWSIDLTTGDLTGQWINTDGSAPATIFFVQSNHLFAGGDPTAFQTMFSDPLQTVTLRFISV